MEDYIKAGKIASKAREFGIKLLKEGAFIKDIVEKIEGKIKDMGGEMAFPVNISSNEFAAHDTADNNDERIIKKGDVVKVDVGVHINGYIADTAKTKEVGTNRYRDLIMASEKALEQAIKLLKPGIKLWEIGETIEQTIMGYGFNPIRNLSGHMLERYILHAGISIPNYNNNNKEELKKGQAIALEPFATDGVGIVVDKGEPKIFGFEKKSRISRSISMDLKRKYGNLPFAKTWLNKRELFYLHSMIKEGAIRAYPPLAEKSGGIVSQTEHTIIIDEKPIVTTK